MGNAVYLLNIDSDRFNLIIKGKPEHPDLKMLNPDFEELRAELKIIPENCKINYIEYFDPEKGKQKVEDIFKFPLTLKTFPFFYEYQDYQLFIQGKSNETIEFYHENKYLREAISPLPKKKNELMGSLNFRSDIGYSELEIRGGGYPLLTLKIEVFPSKIDYQQDYFSLVREVNEEVYNLAYDFLRRTFQEMKIKEEQKVTHAEFFSILQIIFENFMKSFYRIEKSPHHRLHKTHSILPASRVKKINNSSIKWLQKNPQHYDYELDLPVKMLNIEKRVSYDTFENRFVKWILTRIVKKLNEFKERYLRLFEGTIDQQVIKRIEKMKGNLERLINRTFLHEVGDLYKLDSLSLVLQMAPGYREIYKYYLMLIKGLTLNGDLFRLSIKELWELYEYWCFLKLNRILCKKYKLVKQNLIDLDFSGVNVKLAKSASSKVEYVHPKTGEKFYLTYNKTQGEGITTNQKPDNVLTLQKIDSKVEYKFIFDAKYRIDPAYPGSPYYQKYRLPGPKEDDINTMHRYRDAIVYQNKDKYERLAVGAYILFPYPNEDEFKEHDFYQSIKKVNVGAFPFLPGSTKLVSEFLEGIIEESSLGNFERHVLPAGYKDHQKKTDFHQNVLVGNLRQKIQLERSLAGGFYHIPCKRLPLHKKQLKFVALYLKQNTFEENSGVSYYGRIKKIEVKKRKEINIPLSRNSKPEEPYYVFYVDEWKKIIPPIKPEGIGVRGSHIYTNDMLLLRAQTVPELCIKTFEEWRLWLELKRIKKELKVLIQGKEISSENEIGGFKVNDIVIKVKEGYVLFERKSEIILKVSINDFLVNTWGIMKRFINN